MEKQFVVKRRRISGASDEELLAWSEDPNCENREECRAEIANRLAFFVTELDASNASNEVLESWASNANCRNKELCKAELARRSAEAAELLAHPFDPRKDISADGKYIADRIVKHMWILGFVIPIAIAILVGLFRAS